MFILFYHGMNADQSFDNLPFSGVNQEKPHNQNFKITILWGGLNKKKTVYLMPPLCGKVQNLGSWTLYSPLPLSLIIQLWVMEKWTLSLFTLHHYSETDTYHGSLLPGKFADIQQVSLTKVNQLVNKLGGQFVPSCVHDQPCCTEQPFDSRGSGRRCEIPGGKGLG